MDRVSGWYNVTRSEVAHRFEDGYPLCMESDVGDVIPHEPDEKFIRDICYTCRQVINRRVMDSIRALPKTKGQS